MWRLTVAALPGEWFRSDQAPLLDRYARHVARAGVLEAMLAATDPVADLVRYGKLSALSGQETGRILALARSLRITNQSRIHPVTAGNRAASAVPARTPDDDARAVAELVELTIRERKS